MHSKTLFHLSSRLPEHTHAHSRNGSTLAHCWSSVAPLLHRHKGPGPSQRKDAWRAATSHKHTIMIIRTHDCVRFGTVPELEIALHTRTCASLTRTAEAEND